MKKTIIATLTALTLTTSIVSGALYASGSKSPQAQVEKLTQRLNLDDAQQTELLEMFSNRADMRDQMKEKLTKEQRKEMKKTAREGMRDQMHKDIKSILTTEQIAKFDQMHADKGEKHGKGRQKDH